ncbi:DUF892 family protein [Paracoccus sp. S-4012]|uniref:DUF892 family protein n=1 Tax=Paracoccus sp. S-4012 TaxID=2665648 RepID=UPI00351B2606
MADSGQSVRHHVRRSLQPARRLTAVRWKRAGGPSTEFRTLPHLEIAFYRVLIAAAEQLDKSEAARACRTNLQEEIAMAKWLEEQLPAITHAFLDRPEPYVPERDTGTGEH